MRIFSGCFIVCLKLYQWFLSPLLQSLGAQCRFTPSCSRYALEAVSAHGAFKGAWLAGTRLLRCHPFCAGGHDPVPPPVTDRLENSIHG